MGIGHLTRSVSGATTTDVVRGGIRRAASPHARPATACRDGHSHGAARRRPTTEVMRSLQEVDR